MIKVVRELMLFKEKIDNKNQGLEWENTEVKIIKQDALNLIDEIHVKWMQMLAVFMEDEEKIEDLLAMNF